MRLHAESALAQQAQVKAEIVADEHRVLVVEQSFDFLLVTEDCRLPDKILRADVMDLLGLWPFLMHLRRVEPVEEDIAVAVDHGK